MIKYAAFLRGIMPTNPNMRNEKLREVFESLGLTKVQTIISSGNVVFESEIKDIQKLEEMLEQELAKQLGLKKNPVIIRSEEQLKKILAKDPFRGKTHGKETYLVVSFQRKAPHEIYTVIDLTKSDAVQFMGRLEKERGKEITTRTWKTVERIAKKLEISA